MPLANQSAKRTTTLTPLVPQACKRSAASSTSGALLAAAILADTPKLYWKCQEASGVPIDSSGNGLNASATSGTPLYRQADAPSLADFMILFDGGASATRNTISTVVQNFTLEVVFQPQVITVTNQNIVYNGNSSFDGWGIMLNTNGKLQPLLGGVTLLSETTTVLNVGTTHWYHVVFVKRAAGTAPEVWINGSLDGAAQGTNAPNAPTVGTTALKPGTSLQAGCAHFALYESALSSARIAAHYAACGTT